MHVSHAFSRLLSEYEAARRFCALRRLLGTACVAVLPFDACTELAPQSLATVPARTNWASFFPTCPPRWVVLLFFLSKPPKKSEHFNLAASLWPLLSRGRLSAGASPQRRWAISRSSSAMRRSRIASSSALGRRISKTKPRRFTPGLGVEKGYSWECF